jgi:hypothetical protein
MVVCRKRILLILLPLLVSIAWLTPLRTASAQQREPDPEKIKQALSDGIAWLRKQQRSDGSWEGIHTGRYPMGTTALALLAMLKCDVHPRDPAVREGFEYLRTLQFRRTYSVSLLILALEARYHPPKKYMKKHPDKPYETVARKAFRFLAPRRDKKWMEAAVQWLLSKQEEYVWRYPSRPGGGRRGPGGGRGGPRGGRKGPGGNGGGRGGNGGDRGGNGGGQGGPGAAENQDNSNTQYAILALKSASRVGISIPRKHFRKVLEYFIANQDKWGPEVEPFSVPAADAPIYKRKKRRSSDEDGDGGNGDDRTVERRNPDGTETGTMRARGWSYLPRTGENGSRLRNRSTGSMTTSGIAALAICKSELERNRAYWKKWKHKANQAIRDGCAWLAHYFRVDCNPRMRRAFHYYYLYGLERAGVLAGTYDFGKHDWYNEGAHLILKQQKPKGYWEERFDGRTGPLATTCFALLFLKRATIPLVKMPPKRVLTGVGTATGD